MEHWRQVDHRLPDDFETLESLSRGLIALGRKREALPYLQRLSDIHADSRRAHVLLARTAEELGKTDLAVGAWTRLSRMAPADDRGQQDPGGLRRPGGDQARPPSIRVQKLAARRLDANGRHEEGMILWRGILDLRPNDSEAFLAMLAGTPAVARVEEMLRLGRLGPAQSERSTLRRRHDLDWAASYLEFKGLIAERRLGDAANLLAGRDAPGTVPVDLALETLIGALGPDATDHDEVFAALCASESAEVLSASAVACLERGMVARSEFLFARMIEVEPRANQVKSHVHKWTKTAIRASFPEQAVRGLRLLLDLAPDDEDTYLSLLTLACGTNDRALGEFCIARAEQQGLSSAAIWLGVAEFYAGFHEHLRAEAIALRLAEDGQDPRPHRLLADLLERRFADEAALGQSELVARISGEPEDFVRLGKRYELQGRNGDAEAAYRAALAASPLHHPAIAALFGLGAPIGDLPPLDRANIQSVVCHSQLALTRNRARQALSILESYPGIPPLSAQLLRAAILRKIGRLDEALGVYQDVLKDHPRNYRAINGVALGLCGMGDYLAANEALANAPASVFALGPAEALKGPTRREVHFGLHELKQAWASYWSEPSVDILRRFPDHIRPANLDEPQSESGLLTLACFGVGDELRWASVYPDLAVRAPGLKITCEPRLAQLFRRSFPGLDFLPTRRSMGKTVTRAQRPTYDQLPHRGLAVFMDNDGWAGAQRQGAACLVTDWLAQLRSRLEDFSRPTTPLLQADPNRRSAWRTALAALPHPVSIGISWHSATVNIDRSAHYTDLSDWGAIFAVEGVNFVNLQYDFSPEDVRRAKADFGVDVWTPPGLDLKADIDGVAALASELDLVLAPCNMLAELAGGLGVPTLLMANVPAMEWRRRSDGGDVWFPSVEIVFGDRYFDKPSVIRNTARRVTARVAQTRRSASQPHAGDGTVLMDAPRGELV